MMKNTLLNDFYTEFFSDFSPENQQEFKCRICLHAEHPIYKGHFPQIPIVPGVCLTQMIKEILMEKFNTELSMISADNIKFLAMVNPLETPELELLFNVKKNEGLLDVNATYTHEGKIYTKFKGRFSVSQ
jgi:3-hydroxyacyl-[acyl-carrier-protein] dehydratase